MLLGIKRLMGRRIDDPEVQKNINKLPYKLIDDEGKLKVQVTFKGQVEAFTPEEISAYILKDLKKAAEAKLGGEVSKAIISMPAYFNDAQRSATMEAARLAGFSEGNLKMLTEPTAGKGFIPSR